MSSLRRDLKKLSKKELKKKCKANRISTMSSKDEMINLLIKKILSKTNTDTNNDFTAKHSYKRRISPISRKKGTTSSKKKKKKKARPNSNDIIILLIAGYIRKKSKNKYCIPDSLIENIIVKYYQFLDQWDGTNVQKGVKIIKDITFKARHDQFEAFFPFRIYGKDKAVSGQCKSWKIKVLLKPKLIDLYNGTIGVTAVCVDYFTYVGSVGKDAKYNLDMWQRHDGENIAGSVSITFDDRDSRSIVKKGDVITVSLDLSNGKFGHVAFKLNDEQLNVTQKYPLDINSEYVVFVQLPTTMKNDYYKMQFVS
eukprot:193746_1